MGQALDASQPLATIRMRLAASAARFAAVEALLPPDLRDCVRPGPVDESTWTLLVPHSAAAAKLRNVSPVLVRALAEKGWESTSIRVWVQRP
jgi:hypothetical protein